MAGTDRGACLLSVAWSMSVLLVHVGGGWPSPHPADASPCTLRSSQPPHGHAARRPLGRVDALRLRCMPEHREDVARIRGGGGERSSIVCVVECDELWGAGSRKKWKGEADGHEQLVMRLSAAHACDVGRLQVGCPPPPTHLSLSLSVSLCPHLSVYLSIHSFIHSSICQNTHTPYIHLHAHPSSATADSKPDHP